eukprot:SAG31_NODE_19678_length_594_cov_2.765657_1_plen_140_part_01
MGTGDIASDVGVKADVDLVTKTPDQESTLTLKKPAHVHDGPAIDSKMLNLLDGYKVMCADVGCQHCDSAPAAAFPVCCVCVSGDGATGDGWQDNGQQLMLQDRRAERLGTLNPLAAKVRSAPNLLEPVELLEAKQAIRYS